MEVSKKREHLRAQSVIAKELIKRCGKVQQDQRLLSNKILKLRNAIGELRSDAVSIAPRAAELSTEWYQDLLSDLQKGFP